MTATKQQIVEGFRLQADWCERLESDLYATILKAAVEDLEFEGPVFDVVDGFGEDPVAAALALRLMGGIHRLVLMGLAPDLAAHFKGLRTNGRTQPGQQFRARRCHRRDGVLQHAGL